MKQEEFLHCFQEALVGKVPENVIHDNVAYYRNYINSRICEGKTEDEILESLGDPRLLAKTIEESSKFANGEENMNCGYDGRYSQNMSNNNYYRENRSDNEYDTQQEKEIHGSRRTIKIPGWLITILVILVMALVIVLAFSLISFFAPVILTGLVIALICSLIKAWRQRY